MPAVGKCVGRRGRLQHRRTSKLPNCRIGKITAAPCGSAYSNPKRVVMSLISCCDITVVKQWSMAASGPIRADEVARQKDWSRVGGEAARVWSELGTDRSELACGLNGRNWCATILVGACAETAQILGRRSHNSRKLGTSDRFFPVIFRLPSPPSPILSFLVLWTFLRLRGDHPHSHITPH